jgi:hypothetical protein
MIFMMKSDRLFCETGKRLDKLTTEQTNIALEKQKVDRAIGINKPIGAYLVEEGVLTKDDVLLILKEQEQQKSKFIANIKKLLNKFSGNLASDNVYFPPNIPSGKASNAIKSYGKDVQLEDILMLVDETFFGSSTDGFLLTESGLYCKNQDSLPWVINFEDIQSIRFETSTTSRTIIFNDYFQLTTNIFGEKPAEVLFKIIKAVTNGEDPDLQQVVPTPKQVDVSAGDVKKMSSYIPPVLAGCGGCLGLFFIVSIMLGMIGYYFENAPEIDLVKNGSLQIAPDKTVEELVNGFMGNPTWESGVTTEGDKFVNVTGNITFHGKEVEAVLQFEVDKNNKNFSIRACEFNGIPQSNFMMIGLLTKMAEAGDT